MSRTIAPPVNIAPRRLGHANLFVSQLGRSMQFYNRVCGFEEVRREPGIKAGFLSNGNTHHDLGLMEIGRAPRVGVGGHVQIPKGRGTRPGLNHLGWEVESELRLVEAYRRARAAGLALHRTTDHQLSHSVYIFDPDGNLNEFYADVVDDWRAIFNPDREDLISSFWDPEAAPASPAHRYNPAPEIRRVPGAAFHPVKITHVVLVAREFEPMREFYTEIAGLRPASEAPDGRLVCLRGTSARYDLVLCRSDPKLTPGLHHMAFEVSEESDLESGQAALPGLGVDPEFVVDNQAKRSLFFRDPDGLGIEMYRLRAGGGGPVLAGPGDAKLQPYLV